MQIKLNGRIQKMISGAKGFITLIQTPAPDPYSQPSTYKLSSDTQLGQPGDDFVFTCNLRSWVKIKPYKDKETHVQKEFWEQNIIFDVISSEPVKSSVKAVS